MDRSLTYYAFGEPTINSTTDYTTISNPVLVSLKGNKKSVCIIQQGELVCFKSGNYDALKQRADTVFGSGQCYYTGLTMGREYVYYYRCQGTDWMHCAFFESGDMICERVTSSIEDYCTLSNNSAYCSNGYDDNVHF